MNRTHEIDPAKSADGPGKPKGHHPKKAVRDFSRFHTLAIEMAVAVIAPALGGRWLDTKTGKDPWFTILGFALGGAAAIRSAWRTYDESRRSIEQADETSCSEQPK